MSNFNNIDTINSVERRFLERSETYAAPNREKVIEVRGDNGVFVRDPSEGLDDEYGDKKVHLVKENPYDLDSSKKEGVLMEATTKVVIDGDTIEVRPKEYEQYNPVLYKDERDYFFPPEIRLGKGVSEACLGHKPINYEDHTMEVREDEEEIFSENGYDYYNVKGTINGLLNYIRIRFSNLDVDEVKKQRDKFNNLYYSYYEEGEPLGVEATRFVKDLIAHKEIVLDVRSTNPEEDKDSSNPLLGHYGRVIATIYVKHDGDWINVNRSIIRSGLGTFDNSFDSSSISDERLSLWEQDQLKAQTSKDTTTQDHSFFKPEAYKTNETDHRDEILGPFNEYKEVRIGDVKFRIPPTDIHVATIPDNNDAEILRNNTTLQGSTGHLNKQITMNFYVSGKQDIDGKKISGAQLREDENELENFYCRTEKEGYPDAYYVNGLRCLLAQFKVAPFVPIENHMLNNEEDIQAVSLQNITIQNTIASQATSQIGGNSDIGAQGMSGQGLGAFPETFKVTLTLVEFNHKPYLYTSENYSNHIDWSLFRFNYQRLLEGTGISHNGTKFPKVGEDLRTEGNADDVVFFLADAFDLEARQESLRNLRNQKRQDSLDYTRGSTRYEKVMHDKHVFKIARKQKDKYLENKVEYNFKDYDSIEDLLVHDTYDYIEDFNAFEKYITELSNINEEVYDNIRRSEDWISGMIMGTLNKRRVFYYPVDTNNENYTLGLDAYAQTLNSYDVERPDVWRQQFGFHKREGNSVVNFLKRSFQSAISQIGENFRQLPFIEGEEKIVDSSHFILPIRDDRMINVVKEVCGEDVIIERKVDDNERIREEDALNKSRALVKLNERQFQILYGQIVDVAKNEKEKYEKTYEAATENLQDTVSKNPWVIDGLVLRSLAVSKSNTVVPVKLQSDIKPTQQYMGSNEIIISLSFVTKNKMAPAMVNEMISHAKQIQNNYSDILDFPVMEIENSVTNLFDLDGVGIQSKEVNTIPGIPEAKEIMLTLVGYKKDKPSLEEVGKVKEDADYFDLEETLKYKNLYPDLELPKYKDLPMGALKRYKNDEEITFPDKDFDDEIYVDPDFYIMYKQELYKDSLKHILEDDYDYTMRCSDEESLGYVSVNPSAGEVNIEFESKENNQEDEESEGSEDSEDSEDSRLEYDHEIKTGSHDFLPGDTLGDTVDFGEGFLSLEENYMQDDYRENKPLKVRLNYPKLSLRVPNTIRHPSGENNPFEDFFNSRGEMDNNDIIGWTTRNSYPRIEESFIDEFDTPYSFEWGIDVTTTTGGHSIPKIIQVDESENAFFTSSLFNIVKLRWIPQEYNEDGEIIYTNKDLKYGPEGKAGIVRTITRPSRPYGQLQHYGKLYGPLQLIEEEISNFGNVDRDQLIINPIYGYEVMLKEVEEIYNSLISTEFNRTKITLNTEQFDLTTSISNIGRSNNARVTKNVTIDLSDSEEQLRSIWNMTLQHSRLVWVIAILKFLEKFSKTANKFGTSIETQIPEFDLSKINKDPNTRSAVEDLLDHILDSKNPEISDKDTRGGMVSKSQVIRMLKEMNEAGEDKSISMRYNDLNSIQNKDLNDRMKETYTDMLKYDKRGRLVRAFPTYHLMLIDENEDYWWWNIRDNFYEYNGVRSIDVVKDRKNVTDTCMIKMQDKRGMLLDPDTGFKKEEHDLTFAEVFWNMAPSGKLEQLREEADKDITDGVMLDAGAKVQLRVGYGTSPYNIPTMFNGKITELQPDETGNIVVVAQSYGTELSNPVPAEPGEYTTEGDGEESWLIGINTSLGFFNDPQQVIRKKLRGWRGFFGEMVRNASNDLFYNEHPLGIGSFGKDQRPDYWGDRGADYFSSKYTGDQYEIEQNINASNVSEEIEDLEFSVMLEGKTMWDLIQVCSMAVPNYIADTHPFDFRSTIFFGHPMHTLSYGYEEDKDGRLTEKTKTFRQSHFYNCVDTIISNQITASSEDLKTIVNPVGYTASGDQEDAQKVHLDVNIHPSYQKSVNVDTSVLEGGSIWTMWASPFGVDSDDSGDWSVNRVATASLQEYVKNMYTGKLIVAGDPTVKPYDFININDQKKDMTGTCEVEKVIHTLNKQDGFITTITPDPITINNEGNHEDLEYLMYNKVVREELNSIDDWHLLSIVLDGVVNAIIDGSAYFPALTRITGKLGKWFTSKTLVPILKGTRNKVSNLLVPGYMDSAHNAFFRKSTFRTNVANFLNYPKPFISKAKSKIAQNKIGGAILKKAGKVGATIAKSAMIKFFITYVAFKAFEYAVINRLQTHYEIKRFNRNAVTIITLTQNDRELTAGIKGHAGALIGDDPEDGQWHDIWHNRVVDFLLGSSEQDRATYQQEVAEFLTAESQRRFDMFESGIMQYREKTQQSPDILGVQPDEEENEENRSEELEENAGKHYIHEDFKNMKTNHEDGENIRVEWINEVDKIDLTDESIDRDTELHKQLKKLIDRIQENRLINWELNIKSNPSSSNKNIKTLYDKKLGVQIGFENRMQRDRILQVAYTLGKGQNGFRDCGIAASRNYVHLDIAPYGRWKISGPKFVTPIRWGRN